MTRNICEIERWENEGGPVAALCPREETRMAKLYNAMPNRYGALKRREATLHALMREERSRGQNCADTNHALAQEMDAIQAELRLLAGGAH